MSFKTTNWVKNQKPNLSNLEVNESDAPDLILMEFKGFDVRPLSKVKKTNANDPRKQNRLQDKICRYKASFSKGIRTKTFPPSLLANGSKEELFDGRHTFEVVNYLNYTYYWFALWEIKECGDPMFDNLTLSQKVSLCGLRLNSLRDFENTVMDDYSRLIRQVMNEADIPFTSKNIQKFMNLTGVYERYEDGSPAFATIENAIKSSKTSTSLVFNTSEKELKEYLDSKQNDLFKHSNQVSSDGYVCSVRTLNKTAHKRYAEDVIRTAIANSTNGNKTRFIFFSPQGNDAVIEQERQDIIDEVYKQFVSPINFYTKWLNNHSLIKSDYPIPSIEDLGMQIFGAAQIEGETDHILLEPNI
jgi:hypothetical protein